MPTGVAVAIPNGHVGLICPRSGLASSHGISVLNAPGIIDAGYTGEIKVVLWSSHPHAHAIRRGERIAQLVIVPVAAVTLVKVGSLPASLRGTEGLGSSGAP